MKASGVPSRLPPWIATLVALAVGATGFVLLFVAPHAHLQYALDRRLCAHAPRSWICGLSYAREFWWWSVPVVVDFIGWAVAALLLVLAGHRLMALLVATASVLLPSVASATFAGWVGGRFENVFAWPQPWQRVGVAPPAWLAHPWLGALLATGLVLLAAAVRGWMPPRPAPVRLTREAAAGALTVAVAVAFGAALVAGVSSPMRPLGLGDTPTAIALFALGVGLGTSTRPRVAALVVLPFFLSGLAELWLGQVLGNLPFAPLAIRDLSPSLLGGLAQLLPWIGLAFLAAWSPGLVPALRQRRARRAIGSPVPTPPVS